MKKIPYGYCQCGCGGKAPLARQTTKKLGYTAGMPQRFIHGHYARLSPKGKDSPFWKGGVTHTGEGYKTLKCHEHPNAAKDGRIMHSHIVVESVLSGLLPSSAVVHHVDGNTGNDKKVNLVICQNQAYHLLLHKRQRAYDACGHASWLKCWICKQYSPPNEINGHGKSQTHAECKNRYERQRIRRNDDREYRNMECA